MDKESVIYVTGGAGFIGSNLVRHLNEAGYRYITVIDDLTQVEKFKNLRGLDFAFIDKEEFKQDLRNQEGYFGDIPDFVFHLGAISSTTHKNGKELMEENYSFSQDLIFFCAMNNIPIHYASSASVYGNEPDGFEWPLNGYAFSKWMTDQFVRDLLSQMDNTGSPLVTTPVLGFRYFNVYGPGENHKGSQASVIYNWYHQAMKTGVIQIFNEEAWRDFIFVDDICKIHLHLMENPQSGIIDVGTGKATNFSQIAEIIKDWFAVIQGKTIQIVGIDMPEELQNQYQYYTCADQSLNFIGYTEKLLTVEQGVVNYLNWLANDDNKKRIRE